MVPSDSHALGEDGIVLDAARGPGPSPAEAIGKIQTMIGSVTIARVGGAVRPGNIGDLLYHGDVIQTGADGAVAMTFKDGTAFHLSASARMVLDEFIFNSNATSNSARFSVAQGMFTFIVGKIAKSGGMSIDTPVALIRGARGGATGILTLAALTLAVLDELKAYSDFSIQDDDVIDFKDLRHGVFELLIKGDNPRLIVVDDPGQTIVIHPTGSTFSVDQVANTPTRMAELQVHSLSALSTFTMGQQDSLIQQQQQRTDNSQPITTQAAGSSGDASTRLTSIDGSHSSTTVTVAVATTTPPPNNLPQSITETSNNSNTTTAPSPIPDPSPTPSVNHAPTVATLWTETLKAAEDQAIAISGFSVDDVDGDRLTVTLTATSTLTLASTDGLDFLVGDGAADETMTLSGSARAITAALNGMTYTPSPDFSGTGHISYQVSDGTNTTSGNIDVDVTPVNDAPVTTPVTLAAIAEDSGARLITQAELLANATDVDGTALTAVNLAISSGNGTLVDNGNGTWSYTPALNDDTSVTFSYAVTDGIAAPVATSASATLDITPVSETNLPPVTTPVTLAAIAEDSGARLITQAELLANATDVDGPALTAVNLAITSGNGTLVDNGNGTWSYTPAANDDTSVTFSYAVTDDVAAPVATSATLDITPVNDAPVTTPVTLAAIAEDSVVRLITQAELLANATDVDGPALTAVNLAISSGNGTLVDNHDGTWSYTPAANDDTSVTFSYAVTDGLAAPVAATASLDITPVNDAPTTTPVTLAAIAEDSVVRLITQAELLANATDVDGPSLTAISLAISSGNGTLVDNGNGTWSYTPAANDDTSVTFSYAVTDGIAAPVATSATLDITPVNDAPVTTPVTLAAIAEDSVVRLITQAELLANATDVDGPALTAVNLAISSGNGTLVDNHDGTWSYTPAANDDTSVTFSYAVTDGLAAPVAATASLDITPVNDAPTTTPVTLAAIAEDSVVRLITQAELLANATDVDGPALTAISLAISSGNGTLVDNGNGTWSYTPAANDDTSVTFSYAVTDDVAAPVATSATLDITPVNDAPVTTPVTLAAIAEDSGARLITQAELLANATDVDGPALTAVSLAISSGNGTLVDNGNGTWSYTPALNDDTSVTFSYAVTDGVAAPVATSATLDITPVNDAPVTTPVTLAAIAEDSGARLITQAELLANATDVDGPSLTAVNLAISSGNGTLVDNGNGTWSYTPALNDDTSVSFSYAVTDGIAAPVATSATLDITPVSETNLPPVTTPVTLAAIAEDSGTRLITQAELLANATDVDGPALTAVNLAISSGNGTLVDNGNGTWSYTPAANDDTSVTFSYAVTDGLAAPVAATASLDITPVNDAPTTTPVTLAAIAEDSVVRLITQAELLANATDVDGPSLTAINLAISSGNGTLVDNGNGTWSYTPAANDDTSVTFSYAVTDDVAAPVATTASLDITPVNDAPVTTPVTLAAIAEDSGARLITQAELLANATDVDGPSLTAISLAISSGNGTLVDNGNGTWSYTPALNDDTSVSFSYAVTDGIAAPVATSATLDITPVSEINLPPVTTPVTLAAIAEDSGARLITQAELLANATDVDGPALTAVNLAISSGNGTLVDNGNGSWSYTPAANDDTSVTFSYAVTDGVAAPVATTASLDITPVNDAPVTTPVTLAAIAEDSGARLITQAELLANATDVDGPSLTAISLAISSGNGTLVDNGNGTWSYTPALNDDTSVSFSYAVTDGIAAPVATSATLDITPVSETNLPPVTTPVTLAAIAEDSGARLITQAELLANATDVDGPALTAVNLAISSGNGTLVDNGNGTWSYTPAANDDTSVTFSYAVTDGVAAPVATSATLDITPVNDAPVTTPVTLAAIAEDSGARLITQAELLANATDVDGPALTAVNLAISSGNGTLVDNHDGTWSYTPALNDDTSVTFSYAVTDGVAAPVATSATLDITAVNDAPAGANHAVTTNEDAAYTFTAADFGFSDPNDTPTNSLSRVKITTLPGTGTLTDNGVAVTTGQFINVADINSGLLKFTPAANANGAGYASFTFQVEDDGGTANGGVNLDQSANTMTIDVTAVNDAPAGANHTVTTNEDATYTFTAADFGFSDPNDTPANSLSRVKITTLPGAGTLTNNGVAVTTGQFINVVDINNGLLKFTPAANANGAGYASFTFQVEDDGGTANGGLNLDQSANTMTIDVTAVNDAPAGANHTVTTNEDAAYTFTAADFGFSDPNDTPTNSLSRVKITTLPGVGTLTDNGGAVTAGQFINVADINSGLLKFTPAANANGAGYAFFSFQVEDDGGAANGGLNLDQSANTMTIDVTVVNDAPAGANHAVTTNEDATYTFTAADFGFSDPNDTPANSLNRVKITTLPGAGTLTDNGVAVTTGQFINVADINSGLLKFTPAANANGAGYASFTFQVEDDGGTANGGLNLDQSANTMTIDVTSVNDAPVLVGSLAIALNEGVSVTLATDVLQAVDPDNTAAQLTFNVAITTNGHVAFDDAPETSIFQFTEQQLEDGHVIFVHAGTSTTASFTVSVTDGVSTSAPVTVKAAVTTITVLTTAGMNFQTDNPFQQMGSADIIQPDGVSPSTQFTIINTASNREFVINGTGFTYGPNNVPTGGIITSINERELSTHAPLADFTGLSVGADVWYSVLVAYAAGDQDPFNTLTASWAFIFNDSPGPDVLVGGQQNDRLIATGGDDTLDGEFGRDLADYSSATGPISVQLADGTATGDSIDTDTLKSVEFITGTNFGDTYDASGFSALSTNSGSTVTFDVNGTFNGFEGLGGNDIITGNGDTRVSYLNATSGVTVTLGPNGSGTATGDASVGTDTFISGVFRVRGSNFVDTLTGSNNPAFTVEQFEGRGGNDIINGGGGFDRAIYANEDAAIFVHLAAGQVVGGVNTGTDTLTSVEGIIGTDFSDTYDATSFSGSSTNAGSNGTFNEFEGRGGNDTIIGNGNTRIAFYNALAGVTVTLGVNGIGTGIVTGDASVGTDTIVSGVNAVRGSSFDDTITGDAGNNTLDGRFGADTITAAGGNDTITFSLVDDVRDVIDGGTGNDTVDYSIYAAPLTVVLNTSTPAIVIGSGSSEDNSDTIVNIENFVGGFGNDTITGDTNNNTLTGGLGADIINGGGGTDTLRGGAGADVLNGGAGAGLDIADYFFATSGLTVDLLTPANNTGEAAGDSYISIEGLRGSAFSDVLRGDNNGNFLDGGADADVLDGRGGFDYAAYWNASAGVTANLANPMQNTGEAFGDSYISIEGLIGTSSADTLTGDSNDNRLRGGPGGDALDGGLGNDTAEYLGITALPGGTGVTVDLTNPGNNAGDAVGDTYISIENLAGSNFNDTLGGDGNSNTLTGGAGNDTFVFAQGGGHDTITDFTSGQDSVNVADFGLSASDMQALIDNASGDTINFASGESITFAGINVAALLHTNDFILN